MTETVAVRNDFQALVDAERQECVVKEVVITHTHSHDADTHILNKWTQQFIDDILTSDSIKRLLADGR